MKEGIHPTFYPDAVVVCGTCGTTWRTGSTKKEVHVDICSNCHPFFTGTQRIVDTAGQVERFTKRLAARETIAPLGEVIVSKKQRRAAERAKRSGMAEAQQPEPTPQPTPEAVAAVNTEASATETVAETPTVSAPRERKPRPPRERKPRENKPAEAKPESAAPSSKGEPAAE
ncbi:MAG: 50S ribosomal protein L31 [Chloroflexi bacterium]|nr:50S ribosomal protein L31 [Chloroflexota bacterium]